MALDIDTTKIGRRSNRLGSGPRKAFKGRHSSRGVLPLNQGSSPHGTKNVLKLGGKAGGFGSGRPAGGGGQALLAALAPGASVQGPAPEAGPPPEVGPPPADLGQTPTASPPPRMHPLLAALFATPLAEDQWAAGGTYPVFAPTPDTDAPWFRLGNRWAR